MDLLQIERREMKDLMESLEKKFESEKTVFMEKTNQLVIKLNEERATQALTIEREKVARKCGRLEEEIKHLQMSKRVTETIEQHEKNPKSNVQDSETSKGCSDKKATLFAMEKNPTTLDNALQCVKSSIHNQRIVLGKRQERPTFKLPRTEDIDRSLVHNPHTGRPPTTEIKQIVSVTGNAGTHNLVSNINKPGPFNSNLDVTRSTTITGCSGTCETSHFKNEEVPTVTSQFKVKEVSMYGDDTKYKPINLVLQITINGKQADAIVDTAAQVTVINFDFAKSLDPAIEVKEPVILKGAGKDNSITARYTDRVAIKVGKTETRWRVIVADITDPVILGLDVLQHI
ncbi:Hypothetical predicted protein [Mytilus galloprovincialis]|uniref:Peptidase A2 domain-containing protein n=1 Tax=Mytilus galloprovincialis TaxID=29158 RepID=A0A8B6DX76_MYTGA|nr:Hypothetical predicted protein [Mytilus galloprovincialis]